MIKNKLQIIMTIGWIFLISIFMAIAVYALTTTKELKFFAGIKYDPTIIVDVYINDNLVFSSRAPGEVNQDYIDNIVNDTINFNSNIIAGETYNIRIVNYDTQKDILYTINNNGELSGVIEKNNGTNSNEATEVITITETGLGQTLFSIKLEILYDLKYLVGNDATGLDFDELGIVASSDIKGKTFYVSDIDGLLNLSALVGQVDTTTTEYGPNCGYDNSAGPARTFSGATIQMLNDIDCENGDNEDNKYNFSKTFIPIGYYNFGDIENSFQGTFDGNNKSINGLYVNATEEIRLSGLFGYTLNAEIKNLKMINCKIIAERAGGSIVAYNSGSININNCSSENTYISGTYGNSRLGGIAGYVYNLNIEDCYNTGNIIGGNHVGGIVGDAFKTTITNCYNTGSVGGDSSFNVGGIMGYVEGTVTITNCYNTGSVSGFSCVGGIVGFVERTATITNCYNTESVSGNYDVGGIVGYIYKNGATITNCYNVGSVSASYGDDDAGGIVGSVEVDGLVTITNCYYLKTSSVNSSINAIGENNGTIVSGSYYGTFSSGTSNVVKTSSANLVYSGNILNVLNAYRKAKPTYNGITLNTWKTGSNGYPVFEL